MGLLSRLRGTPEDRFAAEVLDAIKATRAVAEAWYEPDQFAIGWRRQPGGQTGWIYLQNTFRETSDMDRGDRGAQVRRLVAGMVAVSTDHEESWDEARSRLRPVLRPSTFGQGGPESVARQLRRPALPFLSEFVVVDLPDSMSYVSASRLDDWGVTEDDVFAAARENLADLASRMHRGERVEGLTGVRFVDDGDLYCTSLLLVDGFLTGLSATVGARPVAFVADRDSLLVMPDTPEVLSQVLRTVEETYRSSVRSISPVAYTVDDAGAVIAYPVDNAGPLAVRLHRAEAILAVAEYSAQKEVVDAEHEKDGVDIYVAKLMAMTRDDESLFTVTVWADGVDSLLPVADYIAFPDPAGSWFVPWAVVADQVGLMPADDLDPERCRVSAWPVPEVMDQLRARAVEP
jgi:hypothetical protein